MKQDTHYPLSTYQQGILTELGIAVWHRQESQPAEAQVEEQSDSDQTVSASKAPEKNNQAQALAAIQRLKSSNQVTKDTQHVLLAVPAELAQSKLLHDVLLALNVDDKDCESITAEQLPQYTGYPLCWTESANLAFSNNQLSTPDFKQLCQAQTKKQLFHLLHQQKTVSPD